LLVAAACGKESEPTPYKGHWIVGTWVMDSMRIEYRDTLLTEAEQSKFNDVDTESFNPLLFLENQKGKIGNRDVSYQITSDSTWKYEGLDGGAPSSSRALFYTNAEHSIFCTSFLSIARTSKIGGSLTQVRLHIRYVKE